jgi:hypothetical protein
MRNKNNKAAAVPIDENHCVKTRRGQSICVNDDVWHLNEGYKNFKIDFSRLKGKLSPEMLSSLKINTAWYVVHKSAHHCNNMVTFATWLIDYTYDNNNSESVKQISEMDLLNYLSKLDDSTEFYLGSIKRYLLNWFEISSNSISIECKNLLEMWSFRRNQIGVAVLTHDPRRGSLTQIEQESIYSKLNSSLEKGEIKIKEYVISMLFMSYGQRPIQYSLLKCKDLVEHTSNSGNKSYVIRIPRAKQRNVLHRVEFKNSSMSQKLWRIIQKYIESELVPLSKEFNIDIGEMPIFPDKYFNQNGPIELKYHSTSDSISRILILSINKLKIISDVTGEQLNIFPYRIRRTVGTNAAIEGHSVDVIANLLDHSDNTYATVYIEATPELIDRIDKQISNVMIPLAQAFCGTLVGQYSNNIREIDPDRFVLDPRYCSDEKKPMGICGSYNFCYLSAPIACYTCQFFNPWADGPHEELLEQLIRERDEIKKSCDVKIASINDLTILAVMQVIELVKAHKKDLA